MQLFDTDKPQTNIIFTGKLDSKDAADSDQYAEQIKKFSYLSIIGVQSQVDVRFWTGWPTSLMSSI